MSELADAVGILADETYWFIAVVTPNTEKSCEKRLKSLFIDDAEAEFATYIPIQRELHEWPSTGKRVWVDKVLCPCFLFIRCTDEMRYTIACKAKFILHFLMDRARKGKTGKADFARIPHSQMIDFMRLVGDADTPVTIDPTLLHAGSKVRVKNGRFVGLEGYLEKDPDGSSMLALRVDFLGYAKIAFPIELLELID